MLLIACFAAPSFAINPGTRINYTSYAMGTKDIPVFRASLGSNEYNGTCAELGVERASSGTGTIRQKNGNNTKVVKMLYQLLYVDKVWDESKRNVSLTDYWGLSFQTTWTVGQLATFASQIYADGPGTWRSKWESSLPIADEVVRWYNNYDTSNIVVPGNFVMYYVDGGNDQNFVLWGWEALEGKVKLKKASSNPSITG